MSALGQWWISSPLQEVIQTSNPTESLHATVWRRAPKSKHSGKKTAELAVALAVMQHNKVATALVDAVDSLGVSPGAEVVRVASLYETANSQPCHKAVSKTKALGKLQLGVWQEAKGGLYESEAPWAVCHTVSVLSPVTLTCVNYKLFPYKYWIWFTHFHYIFTICCWYKKQS